MRMEDALTGAMGPQRVPQAALPFHAPLRGLQDNVNEGRYAWTWLVQQNNMGQLLQPERLIVTGRYTRTIQYLLRGSRSLHEGVRYGVAWSSM